MGYNPLPLHVQDGGRNHPGQGNTPGTAGETAGDKTQGLVRVGTALSPNAIGVLTLVSAWKISVAAADLFLCTQPSTWGCPGQNERAAAEPCPEPSS